MFDDEETSGLTCFEPEHPSSLVLFSQDFEEESFDYSHRGPPLGTRRPMDDDLGPIFDEEDEPGPTFEAKHQAEAPSVTSIIMENQLCFDPGTTPTPLSTYIQEHCEKLDLINSLPEMFVKISYEYLKHFGFDKVKKFRVSNSIFENMVNSFQVFEPDNLSDQKRFQIGNDINSNLVLSFDQFLKHSKGFDHLEKSLEFGLQQHVFRARKSFDSFVLKENGFDLSFHKHELLTGDLFASTCALDELMIFKTLLEQKSPRVETDFCDSLLKLDIFCFETDRQYDSQSELTVLCSDFEKDRHGLKMFSIMLCIDTILACPVSNKCKEQSIDRAYQPEIWRCWYSRKMASKLQGSFCANFPFPKFYMSFKFFLSDSFHFDTCKMDLRSNLFQDGGNDALRIIDPGQDDATMAEPDDSSTKDKPGWINGEHTDLKPAGETEDELKQMVDELEPAEESMHELKPAEVRVDELDEVSELSDTTLELDKLSDTTLELSELSDTEDGAGLAAGRNGSCSAQGKVHKKCNTEHFLFLVEFPPSKHSLFRWTCASYQATFRNPSFVGIVRHIKQQMKSGSIKRLSAALVSPFNPLVLPFGEFISP
ncbi:hypothetical protein DY000_02032098 [Brassica cretica]|uniref:Uncharacterized protein n=1 Tax=Brassica cretica TaxID=69181 RepID=A0ABQ7DDN6_BRACR|nr:hypothetical protein DY000_02032098 [Brassica cretica]